MSASTSSLAARPRAIRLHELPAEVPADDMCWGPVQDQLRCACSKHNALPERGWPARAGPAGVRGPSNQAVCGLARGLDTGLHAADSLQARTLTDE